MPVVAGRTHIPSTPIPILHKQPILSAISGSKSPALLPFQNSVDTTFHEIDKFQNQRRHDNAETRSSLSIPADNFKSTSETNGGHLEVPDSHLGSHATTMYRDSADMSRFEEGSLGHPNGDVIRSFSSKNHCGPRPLIGNNDNLGTLNSTSQERSLLEDANGGITSFDFMGPKVLTHFRSRRRPRSVEGRHQRHLAREGYDTTTSSEGSEADTLNSSPHDSQAGPRVDRVKEGAQQSLDQESLWVEFERLDSELQGMKRGVGSTSPFETILGPSHSQRSTSDAAVSNDAPLIGSRGIAAVPVSNSSKSSFNSCSSPLQLRSKTSAMISSDSRHSQSQNYNLSWRSSNAGSTDDVGLQEVDMTKLTGSDLSDHSSVVSRRSTASTRRKPRFGSLFGTRQTQPRAVVDWK